MLGSKVNGKEKIVLLSRYRAKSTKINIKGMVSQLNKLRNQNKSKGVIYRFEEENLSEEIP